MGGLAGRPVGGGLWFVGVMVAQWRTPWCTTSTHKQEHAAGKQKEEYENKTKTTTTRVVSTGARSQEQGEKHEGEPEPPEGVSASTTCNVRNLGKPGVTDTARQHGMNESFTRTRHGESSPSSMYSSTTEKQNDGTHVLRVVLAVTYVISTSLEFLFAVLLSLSTVFLVGGGGAKGVACSPHET